MADYVNAQLEEYDNAYTLLTNLHRQIETDMKDFQAELIQLTGRDGDFYVEHISSKIKYLIDTLRSQPQNKLFELFKASEQNMETFMDALIQLDKIWR